MLNVQILMLKDESLEAKLDQYTATKAGTKVSTPVRLESLARGSDRHESNCVGSGHT